MSKTQVFVDSTQIISDFFTPVGIFALIRERYSECLLLESNEYHGQRSGRSIICLNPLESFVVIKNSDLSVKDQLDQFLSSFTIVKDETDKGDVNGLFGYTGYDAVQYFEEISFKKRNENSKIPDFYYSLYEYILVFDHKYHHVTVTRNSFSKGKKAEEFLIELESYLKNQAPIAKRFRTTGSEEATITDEQFLGVVEKLKTHIERGDVFQVVPSRKFTVSYEGDEFQVYRALRSINPSPYLFFFNYNNFSLFGSSPETALVIEKKNEELRALVNPIAGTVRRSGDDAVDKVNIEQLKNDPKEASEHVMLVDLARNDLSKSCYPVTVDTYKEVHAYSHLYHLVSCVVGRIEKNSSTAGIFSDVFPAGTVSGAPKFRAMQLIDEVEPESRSFYAGTVGFFGFDGSCIHALTIRSFLGKDNKLTYQAGAGLVKNSIAQNELEEINNKLRALRLAIKKGEALNG